MDEKLDRIYDKVIEMQKSTKLISQNIQSTFLSTAK